MTDLIIGRQEEQNILKRLLQRKTADFIAIYGRRRVGKTYLIRHFFQQNSSCLYFEATGLKEGETTQQLHLFASKISEIFYEGIPLATPQNWLDAFKLLTTAIERTLSQPNPPQKIILFIDEIPWFSTPKSGFVQALDYYWNTKWSTISSLKLIVCGSAASWIINTLIHAKGGLHNRLTAVIPLHPFTLKETEEYLFYKGVRYTKRQIVELYMAVGGIPHYLNAIEPGLSVNQNLNHLCFQKNGLLFHEFKHLFSSLFDSSEAHNELIRLIGKAREGISRDDILRKATLSSSGGMFKNRLTELEEAGFITSFTPYGNKNKGTYFRIIDEYVLFYLKWIEPAIKRLSMTLKNEPYWESKMQTQSWKSWSGYAFESICFKHIDRIKDALGLTVIACEIGSWREIPKKGSAHSSGCQIDLLIDRADGIINLIEIKFYQGKYALTKKEADNINHKISVYKNHSKTNKPIYVVLLSADGLLVNNHSQALVTKELTLTDLF